MRSFLHTVQKNQMLMMTPNSLGRSGVIKSFIKHTTPLKVDSKVSYTLNSVQSNNTVMQVNAQLWKGRTLIGFILADNYPLKYARIGPSIVHLDRLESSLLTYWTPLTPSRRVVWQWIGNNYYYNKCITFHGNFSIFYNRVVCIP